MTIFFATIMILLAVLVIALVMRRRIHRPSPLAARHDDPGPPARRSVVDVNGAPGERTYTLKITKAKVVKKAPARKP